MADIRARLEIPCPPVAPGMAFGTAFSYRDINLSSLEQKQFPVENLHEENGRFAIAIQKSKEQLTAIQKARAKNGSGPMQAIFEVQLSLLQDEQFLAEIWGDVQTRMLNLEHVIASKIKTVGESFRTMQNEYVRSKFSDIQDAYHRILRNLLEIDHVRTNTLQRITSPIILVSERLLPSDIALLDINKLLGVVLEEVSSTSHVAIMLKALGVPAVGNTRGVASLIHTGNPVLLNAEKGSAIVFPNEGDLEEWKHWQQESQPAARSDQQRRLQRTTHDNKNVAIQANIGSVIEAQEALRRNADGIGLLRSEIFYMSRNAMPDIDLEAGFIRELLALMPDRPVTIRLLDLGADKKVSYLPMPLEGNPQLGSRGIRYLLQNPELLNRQVSAVIKAGCPDQIRLLIPFVGIVEDVIRARELIHACYRSNGVSGKIPPIGIMVEIPSAALAIESMIGLVDFVSIGTNDLVQYLFAASREDTGLEPYRQTMHPLVLRLIDTVVRCAHAHKKPVTLCGDAASDPAMLYLLIGLGIRSFSISAHQITLVTGMARDISSRQAKIKASQALLCASAEEVAALVRNPV
jgi:phosphoenolpyruvate-protein phosphotransferase (PTS system enzyme I)